MAFRHCDVQRVQELHASVFRLEQALSKRNRGVMGGKRLGLAKL